MAGGWGDGHGLADDIPVLPVVLCALGFGCGGTPKSAGQVVESETKTAWAEMRQHPVSPRPNHLEGVADER